MVLFMTVSDVMNFFPLFFIFFFFFGYRALDGGVWMFVYPCCAVGGVGWMHGWCVKILEIVYECLCYESG